MKSPESPRRTLFYSCVGIFVVIAIYLFGAGPAAYYVHRHPTARNISIVTTAYRPFLSIPMFQTYTKFWVGLAESQPPKPPNPASSTAD